MTDANSTNINYARPILGRGASFFKLSFIAALCVIIYKSLSPDVQLIIQANNFDKVVHFGAYLFLTSLALIAFPRTKLITIGVSIAFISGVIEIAQAFMDTGREGSWGDMTANSLGCFVAVGLWVLFARYKASRTSAT